MVGDMDDSPRDVACGYIIVIGKWEACLLLTSLILMLAALSVYALWLRARSQKFIVFQKAGARPYARKHTRNIGNLASIPLALSFIVSGHLVSGH